MLLQEDEIIDAINKALIEITRSDYEKLFGILNDNQIFITGDFILGLIYGIESKPDKKHNMNIYIPHGNPNEREIYNSITYILARSRKKRGLNINILPTMNIMSIEKIIKRHNIDIERNVFYVEDGMRKLHITSFFDIERKKVMFPIDCNLKSALNCYYKMEKFNIQFGILKDDYESILKKDESYFENSYPKFYMDTIYSKINWKHNDYTKQTLEYWLCEQFPEFKKYVPCGMCKRQVWYKISVDMCIRYGICKESRFDNYRDNCYVTYKKDKKDKEENYCIDCIPKITNINCKKLKWGVYYF